ncbi:MAG TPA: VWA domain-containing protein, partial [Bryobacteraceae bacterium]
MAPPTRTLIFCAIAATAAAFLSETAVRVHAQDAAAGFTIKAETRVVLVDAVAVDKKGKFIRDLDAKDFRVWEDGKEQKIAGFSLESAGVSPERPAAHYIAMFFDTSTAVQAAQVAVRQQGIRFVAGFASPDRYMAVANYNANGGLQIAQNFTNDRDRLRKALSQVPAGWSPTPITPGDGAMALEGRARGRGRGSATPPADNSISRNMLASLRSLVDSLAIIRGRKALIFFASGIPLPGELGTDLQLTIKAANKANVAIYTVGPPPVRGGAGSIDASAPSNGSVLAPTGGDQDIVRSLADGTGGLAMFTSNDLADNLGKVAQEQDQYYLLTYSPSVDSAEGSCHELRVKVDRKDLEVRARKSYCASKPADALSGKPPGQNLEARAAANAAGNMTAKMQLPWFYSAPGIAQVDLAMDIVPSAMKFEKEKGKLQGQFDLAGVAYKPDGSIAARVSDAVKLEFDTQQQADAFLKTPYHYQNQFNIAPGQYTFRMAFSSDSSGTHGFGKVEMPLTIDPWNGQALS